MKIEFLTIASLGLLTLFSACFQASCHQGEHHDEMMDETELEAEVNPEPANETEPKGEVEPEDEVEPQGRLQKQLTPLEDIYIM